MVPIRVALLCDYLEEGWPSMDLTGEMILTHLQDHCAGVVEPTRICPTFRSRFSRIPRFGAKRFAFNLDRLLNRYREYPRELSRLLKRENFDLFHVLDHSYAQLVHYLPPERTVVTCHDLDAFRCLIDPQSEPRPKWFRELARRTLTGLQKAALVICDSDTTRSALLDTGWVSADRLTTIYLGTHPECTPDPDPEADAEADRLLGPRQDAESVEILHVGSNIPRKRIDVLLKTFAGIRSNWSKARLIKVGGILNAAQAQQAEELGITNAISYLPFFSPRRPTDRATLAAVYRRADLLLQPSEAEGFGLPIAEAIGCGTPILANDIPVLREIGGDAAIYCPVGNIRAWVEASSQVLNDENRRLHWHARTDPLRRKYRWENHVELLKDQYVHIVRANAKSIAR